MEFFGVEGETQKSAPLYRVTLPCQCLRLYWSGITVCVETDAGPSLAIHSIDFDCFLCRLCTILVNYTAVFLILKPFITWATLEPYTLKHFRCSDGNTILQEDN